MSSVAVVILAVIAAAALVAVVLAVCGAVENIRVAKHTRVDPRADRAAQKAARREVTR
ncbi:hypothetical protein WHI96_26870 [Pseudonocardia tropica]|jgi:hypothetical protein|uniref:Uncharacterized protein n=2 Tax=Pseudonocardia TaxID=1847 RepID=A0ABV1K4C7_9PSEU